MRSLLRAARFEFQKMGPGKTLITATALLLLAQPLSAYIQGAQFAKIGLDATPQTYPELAGPIDPPAYLGFDVLPFGEVVVLVYAALLGAADYRTGELRTTLLAVNKRPRILLSKYFSAVSYILSASFLSIYANIAAMQFAVRDSGGIDPFSLTSDTWRIIFLTTLHWTVLGLMSYSIALASRSWLPPVLVFAPLAIGLGNMLVDRWSGSAYLPLISGKCLAAIPSKACTAGTPGTATALVVWLVLCLGAGWLVFSRRDAGAR